MSYTGDSLQKLQRMIIVSSAKQMFKVFIWTHLPIIYKKWYDTYMNTNTAKYRLGGAYKCTRGHTGQEKGVLGISHGIFLKTLSIQIAVWKVQQLSFFKN